MLHTLTITGVVQFAEQFRVEFGNVSCVVGANATGKSLLLRLVSALMTGSASHLYGPLSNAGLTGEFSHINSHEVTTLRINFRNAGKPTIWVNEKSHTTTANPVVGHRLLNLAGFVRHASNKHLITALHFALTGTKQAPHDEQVNRIAEVIERYGPLLATSHGYVTLSAKGVFHWHSSGRTVPLQEAGSASVHSLATFQVVLATAIEMSNTAPTIVLMDEPLGMVDPVLAAEAVLSLASMLPPNLQLIIATTQDDLPDLIQADAVIRLNPATLTVPVASTVHRPKHAVTIMQEAIETYGSGKEDAFIDAVLRPGLMALGADNVNRIRNHGPGEFGVDVGPFSYPGQFGRRLLVGVQVKSGKVHATSSKSAGAVETLISEVRKALDKRFLDPTINRYRRLDYVIAAVAGHLTPDAQELFYDAFEGDHRVILWDAARMAEEFWKVKFRPAKVKA